MAKFALIYTGGQMAATPEEQQASMEEWGAWFGTLGDAVADMGAPFGTSATVSAGGAGAGGTATGYSLITADSLDAATAAAKGCPVLTNGGSVEVYETIEM